MQAAPEAAARAAALLRTTAAVRERCGQLLARARRGESAWFTVHDEAIDTVARAVADLTRQRFADLRIPGHSRWRHFEAGGVDRKAALDALLAGQPRTARARALLDLAVVSVLLDAGAGADWRYTEPGTGLVLTRSEGLAVASYHAFVAGLFSSDTRQPLQADATGLGALTGDRLAQVFQVSHANPMVGLDGRAALLRRLGEALSAQAAGGAAPRPGHLFDALLGGDADDPTSSDRPAAPVAAHDILSCLLTGLGSIWLAGNAIGAQPLGDCWRHAAVRGEGLTDGWVPFHKLSQWLAYSLLEPFEWSGVPVHGLDALTGLPEYRNGGLLLDGGVLRLRDPSAAETLWQPGDELIVEWRALTLSLLDEVAHAVRAHLHTDAHRMPLAQVLEGGTWAAGRQYAQRLRSGLPPLRVDSDGTVF